MSLNEYQEWTRTTAIYPGADGEEVVLSGEVAEVVYLGLGLGEFGEAQGKIKKIMRDSNNELTDAAVEAILAELGDGIWYIARLLDALGTDFYAVANANREKLESRKARGVLAGSGDDR